MISLLTLLLIVAPFTYGGRKSSVEEITGVVVAYDDTLVWGCFENCDGSLVVRVDSNDRNPSYIRVDLTYRNGKFPKQLIQTNAHWRFRLIRTPGRDEPLYRFIIQNADAYTPERHWLIWRIVSSGEKLPFEQTIPSYSLDGFKQIGLR